MPPKKQNNNSSNNNTILAHVVAVEGERIWWLFLGDQPLPENAKIGKEGEKSKNDDDDDDSSNSNSDEDDSSSSSEDDDDENDETIQLKGWYLFPEPVIPGTVGAESGDFAFRKGPSKDVVPYFGIIARDIPLVNEASLYDADNNKSKKDNKNAKPLVATHKHKESWILGKKDKTFIDKVYSEFVQNEIKLRAKENEKKKIKKAKEQAQKKAAAEAKTIITKTQKQQFHQPAIKKPNSVINLSAAAKKRAEEKLVNQLQGWKILGQKKKKEDETEEKEEEESSSSTTDEYRHAFLRVPHNSSPEKKRNSSSSVLNEMVFVHDVKKQVIPLEDDDNNNNNEAGEKWERTIFVPLCGPVSLSPSGFSSQTVNEDDAPFMISQHKQGKGKHSLLLSIGENDDREQKYALNQALVSDVANTTAKAASSKLFSSSTRNGLATSTTTLERVSTCLQLASEKKDASSSEDVKNLVEFGRLFVGARVITSDRPFHKIIEESEEGDLRYIIKALDSMDFSIDNSNLHLTEECAADLQETGERACSGVIDFVSATTLPSSSASKSTGKRRQRDEQDNNTSSSDEDGEDDDRRASKNNNTKQKKVQASASKKKQPTSKKPQNSAAAASNKKDRNRKSLSSLLQEVAPAVSTSNKGKKKTTSTAKKGTHNDTSSSSDDDDDDDDESLLQTEEEIARRAQQLADHKESARLSRVADLLADVNQSVQMAKSANQQKKQQQQDEQEKEQQSNKNNNNSSGAADDAAAVSAMMVSQSMAYPGAGQSVVPSYGEY